MQDDRLIREYVQHGSQTAFTQIVERYLGLVYSTCLREMGDAQLAEDATQAVFLVLSKRAASLRANTVLSGWLFTIARLTCSNMRRQERRRTHYEARAAREAGMAERTNEAAWAEVEPMLQDAIASLRPPDRDAILLRFFQGCSLLETGTALGMSEDAARKRVSRAVEKLRAHFAKHGVVIPAILLTAMLADRAAQAAPFEAALISQAVGKAILSGAAGSSITSASQGVLKMIWLGRIKTFAVATACVAGGGVAVIAVGAAIHKKPVTVVQGSPANVTLASALPESPKTDVDGIVLKPDGSPAVGAKVWWSDMSSFDDRPPSMSTLTNAHGEFHIDGKSAWTAKLQPPYERNRVGQAIAQVDGFGIGGGRCDAGGGIAAMPDAPIIINLTTAAMLRTQCVDDLGKLVPHVAIKVQSLMRRHGIIFDSFDIPKDLPGTWSAESDANGNVTFSGLPQGWDVQLDTDDTRFVRISGQYPNGRYTLAANNMDHAKPLKLDPAATIEGTVTLGPSGPPAPDVYVMASPARSGIVGVGHTDAAGHYKIDRVAAGKYRLLPHLHAPLDADWTTKELGNCNVATGSHVTGINLALYRGAVVTGRIIRAGTGKPAPNITVFASTSEQPEPTEQGSTDVNGNYRFRILAGDIAVSALQQMGAPEHISVPEGGSAAVNMITNADSEPLPPHSTTFYGSVVDEDGKSVPYADIMATGLQYPEAVNWHSTRDGKFTLVVNAAPTLLLRARNGDDATVDTVRATTGKPLTLRLKHHALAEIQGRVQDSNGKPIAGATVNIFAQDIDHGTGVGVLTTDADGAYRISGMWPNKRYMADAAAPGYGRSQIMGTNTRNDQAAMPGPGETATIDTIVLTQANSFVAGHVVNSQGIPLAGATVSVGMEGPPKTVTDKSGYFHLAGIPPGDVGLLINSDTEAASVMAHAGKTDEVLRTHPLAQERQWRSYSQNQANEHIGKYAPELPATGWVNASPVSMSDLKGKFVVFDIFGCCVDSLYEMQSSIQAFADQGVVGIGLDQENDSPQQVQTHAAKEHLKMPLLIDSGRNIAKGLGSRATESYVLVGRDGKIITAGSELDALIRTLATKLAAEQKKN